MIVLKATQDQVLGSLQAVSGIVERRHTLPILANVLIRKHGGKIAPAAADLGISRPTLYELMDKLGLKRD